MKNIIGLSLLVCLLAMVPQLAFAGGRSHAGAVYAMTNASEGNEVVVFNRNAQGLLTLADSYLTGGSGFEGGIDALGSQGALILSPDKRWLCAVNAGSDEISVFRVLPDGLKLTGTVESGGNFPTSLTLYHNLLYVLNAGDNPNITGFRLSHRGELTPLADSTRDLEPGAYSQVDFDPQGRVLVLTQRDTHAIHVFSVDRQGLPSDMPVTSASEGGGPFGFLFDQRGHLLVSEAGSGAVTSYAIQSDYTLRVLTPSEPNGQAATCWITGNHRGLVYTSNTGSNTLSAYKLRAGSGDLMLLEEEAGTGNAPIDSTMPENGRFLYVLNATDGTIGMFHVEPDGTLTDLGAVGGLPSPFAQGIASR